MKWIFLKKKKKKKKVLQESVTLVQYKNVGQFQFEQISQTQSSCEQVLKNKNLENFKSSKRH